MEFSATMLVKQTDLEKAAQSRHETTQAELAGLKQGQNELRSGQADITEIVSRTHTMLTGEPVPPRIEGRRNWPAMIIPQFNSFAQLQMHRQATVTRETVTMSQTQPHGSSASSVAASAPRQLHNSRSSLSAAANSSASRSGSTSPVQQQLQPFDSIEVAQ